MSKNNETEALIAERGKTHGDWKRQAHCAQRFKKVINDFASITTPLTHSQREALDMIAVKMSRILSGDPSYTDHWDDISGYAILGKFGHAKSDFAPKPGEIFYEGNRVETKSGKGLIKIINTKGAFIELDNGNELWIPLNELNKLHA